MLFNSFEFLIYLPVVFLLYWFVFRQRRWQNLLVVIASYVFYGWWDWRFLFLITFTSLCSFGSGLLLERLEGRRKWQQAVSALNIVVNLTILGVFKYYNFFVENLDALFTTLFNYHLDWMTMKVILPVGISFYTFQALSYSIDVYQKKLPATRDVIEFFAYISFFPQLVAGPIERATNLLPQFQRERRFDYAKAVDGMTQMLWGFFKKLVVADNCAIIVNQHWDEYATLSSPVLLVLALLFTFQIYCDFSGYSDIAIGTARLFGINLMQNFNYPYFSRSIPEFWRRWHISLFTWFRDYIYFPLGGSQCARWKVFRNTFIVFFVSGLWHGANWTFIVWGLYHGLLICLYILLGVNTKAKDMVATGRRLPSLKELGQVLLTFFLVVIGWIFFRADTLSQACDYIYHMFTAVNVESHLHGMGYIFYGIVLLVIEWVRREQRHVLDMTTCCHTWVKWVVCLSCCILIYLFTADTVSTFIYFQF